MASGAGKETASERWQATDAGAVPEAVGFAGGAELREGEMGHCRSVDGGDEAIWR